MTTTKTTTETARPRRTLVAGDRRLSPEELKARTKGLLADKRRDIKAADERRKAREKERAGRASMSKGMALALKAALDKGTMPQVVRGEKGKFVSVKKVLKNA